MHVESHWEDDMILVCLTGTEMMLHEAPGDFEHGEFGFVEEGSIALTVAEVEALAQQLLDAAQDMRRLDQSYREYVERQRVQEPKAA
jgi:hypothetical protein